MMNSYSPRREKKQELNLKRALSAIEYERVMKMRELENKKKQFLTEHRKIVSRNDSGASQRGEDAQERIKRKKNEELQSSIAISNRSSEFIRELKEKPLLRRWKCKRESPSDEFILPEDKQDKIVEPPLNSKVIALYQKGFAGVRHKEREKRMNPFVQSVNSLLEKLRTDTDAADSDKTDPLKSFTRKLFRKYAGCSPNDTQPIAEERPEEQESVHPQKVHSTTQGSGTNDSGASDEVQTKIDSKEIDHLPDVEHKPSMSPLRSMESKKEQISTPRRKNSEKLYQEVGSVNRFRSQHTNVTQTEHVSKEKSHTQDTFSVKTRPSKVTNAVLKSMKAAAEESKKMETPPGGKSSRFFNQITPENTPTPVDRNSGERVTEKTHMLQEERRQNNANGGQKAPKYPNAHDVSPALSELTGILSGTNASQRRNSTSPSRSLSSKISPTPTQKIPRNRQQVVKEPKNVDGGEKKGHSSFPQVSVEDYTHVSRSQTVIVVHEDSNKDNSNPKTVPWYRSDNSNDVDVQDRLKTSSEYRYSDGVKGDQILPESDKPHKNIVDENSMEDEDDSSIPETFMNRDELQPSALSSRSELTSGTRPQSKQEYRKGRRLSIQTSGALRTLASVLNEGNRLSMEQEYESSFREMIDNLTGTEEQTRMLCRPRNTSSGGRRSLSGSREEEQRRHKRSLMASTDKRNNAAFLTNDVYKFLERRSNSKTNNGRRKTLSKLELRLLTQAPGEETFARRNSFSAMLDNHHSQTSLEVIPSKSPSLMSSNTGSIADIAANFVDNEIQKPLRRNTLRTVSEVVGARPDSSAQLSNSVSENGSVSGRETVRSGMRNYSWAPDVSETSDWHILAMEVLAKNRSRSSRRYRTVHHMLKSLAEEYRRQVVSSIYDELRYCTYLRLAPHQVPETLKDCNPSSVFNADD